MNKIEENDKVKEKINELEKIMNNIEKMNVDIKMTLLSFEDDFKEIEAKKFNDYRILLGIVSGGEWEEALKIAINAKSQKDIQRGIERIEERKRREANRRKIASMTERSRKRKRDVRRNK